MSDIEIEFEWPVARYEFRPADAERLAEFESTFGKQTEIPEADLPAYLGHIVSSGETRDVKHKARDLEEAVRKIVEWGFKLNSLPTLALSIARKLGTIGSFSTQHPLSRGLSPQKDELMEWHWLACNLYRMFEGKAFNWEGPFPGGKRTEVQWPHKAAHFQGKVGIYMVPGRDGKPKIAFQPYDLKSALVLSAARMISDGSTLGKCLGCESTFIRGTGSKRRGDARFCSPRCKWEFHNEQRRKIKRKTKL